MKNRLLFMGLTGMGALILTNAVLTPPVVNATTAPVNATSQASASSKQNPMIKVTNTGGQLHLLVNTGSPATTLPNFFVINYNRQQIKFNLSSLKEGRVTITENNQEVGQGSISEQGSVLNAEITLDKTTMKAAGTKPAVVKVGNQQATINVTNKMATKETTDQTSKSQATSSAENTSSTQSDQSKSTNTTSSSSSKDRATSDPVHQVFHEQTSGQSKVTGRKVTSHVDGALNIKIDGEFSDWSNIEKSPMVINGDNDNIKYASLVADDQNIYFYVMMHPVLSGGYTSFQPSGYDLTVGGKEFWISFNNNQTVNLDVGQKQSVPMNIYSSEGGSVDLSGQAVVSKQEIDQKMGDGSHVKGTGYVFECAVPFKDIKGASSTSGQVITLKNSNLWSGELTTTGGSTGPILLAGTGVVIAGWSVYQFTRRKRKLG